MLDSFEEVSEFRSCPLYPNGISWAKKANMIASTAERVIYVLVRFLSFGLAVGVHPRKSWRLSFLPISIFIN
jgi:hypothetical protein